MSRIILCYGDSNTWGFVPNSANFKTPYIRYPRNIRWPGRLQQLLGNQYYVVEEGLNGRTTNLEDPFPPDRNGERYLSPCLYSHAPIDLVVLSLGGNDLKAYYKRSAADVRDGLNSLVNIIQSSHYGYNLQQAPKILIVSQSIPLPISEPFTDDQGIVVFERAIERAQQLIKLYAQLAEETGCYFLKASSDIKPSAIDGVHLDEAGHTTLATLIKDKINYIYS